MEMVNVINWKNWEKYPIHSYRNSSSCLYSCDKIIAKKKYSINVAEETASILRKELLPKNKIYVDSGGYSIINGTIEFKDIDTYFTRYLECIEVIEKYSDYIFSLDIPFFIKSPNFNNTKNIYSINRFVATELIKMANDNPKLSDKLFWVTHFKTLNIFDVWKRLDLDLGVGEVFQNKAIGGLVGLRKVTQKRFSLFIGSAFKCFFDYYRTGNFEKDFRLHFLGVYLPHDRFIITILEKLFNLYLNGNAVVRTSYDSFSFELCACNNWIDGIYHLKKNAELIFYDDVLTVPKPVIQQVYPKNKLIFDEIHIRKINGRCKYWNSMVPLNFHSHRSIDRFFEFVIDEYGIIDLIASDIDKFPMIVRNILLTYQKLYPKIFTMRFIDNVLNSSMIITKFHRWFMDKRDMSTLNGLMTDFIKMVGLREIIF